MNQPPKRVDEVHDEPRGVYRYRHKGSGVVRDRLMAIGKCREKSTTNCKKKTVAVIGKRVNKKAVATVRRAKQETAEAGKKTAEWGSVEIQAVLRKKPKLSEVSTPKLSEASRKKLRQITDPNRAAKPKLNQMLAVQD